MILFVWVLWHINSCKSFNAKSYLNIFIKYIFVLVKLHGISNAFGNLIPNPIYTYIFNIYDLVWLGFMEYQIFKSSLYKKIRYIWLGLVEFYGYQPLKVI